MDKNTQDILESVNFIKDHMMMREDGVTKDELREVVREEIQNLVPPMIEEKLLPVVSKLGGIDKRLDIEAMRRGDENIPGRVSDIEREVFGTSRTSQV